MVNLVRLFGVVCKEEKIETCLEKTKLTHFNWRLSSEIGAKLRQSRKIVIFQIRNSPVESPTASIFRFHVLLQSFIFLTSAPPLVSASPLLSDL